MSSHSNMRRLVSIAALVLVAGIWSVPVAEAGRRGAGGYCGERVVVHRVARPMVVRRVVPRGSYAVWHSGSGPVVGGFLSGLFLGATISHVAPQGFVYWDPYCQEGFATLKAYVAHCSRYRHPSVIQVVEAEHGYGPDAGPAYVPRDCDDGR